MEGQMRELVDALTERGIRFRVHEGGMVTFRNGSGECQVFPSQTYDGMLFVRHAEATRVGTAAQAIDACGLSGGMAE